MPGIQCSGWPRHLCRVLIGGRMAWVPGTQNLLIRFHLNVFSSFTTLLSIKSRPDWPHASMGIFDILGGIPVVKVIPSLRSKISSCVSYVAATASILPSSRLHFVQVKISGSCVPCCEVKTTGVVMPTTTLRLLVFLLKTFTFLLQQMLAALSPSPFFAATHAEIATNYEVRR